MRRRGHGEGSHGHRDTFHHPAVGTRVLALTIHTAEPGTPSEDGLELLASWAATTADAATPASDRP